MTSNSVFQLQNYKDMVDDTQKQLRNQQTEFESFQDTWQNLAVELLIEVGIEIDQITPEFDAALGHMQKGINVQDAYHKKLQSDFNKVTQVSKEIQEKQADDESYDSFLNEKRQELTDCFAERGDIDRQRNLPVKDHSVGKHSIIETFQRAKSFCEQAFNGGDNANDDDDDMQVEGDIQTVKNKCPLTQKQFVTPVCVPDKCKKCVFEKLAIIDYVKNKVGGNATHRNVRCPTPGCPTVITKDSDIETSEIFTQMLIKYFKNSAK